MIVKDSISVRNLRRMLSFYEDSDFVELLSCNFSDSTISQVKIISRDKSWNRGILFTDVPYKSEG